MFTGSIGHNNKSEKCSLWATAGQGQCDAEASPPVASSSIFSMDLGPKVVLMMSATACSTKSMPINNITDIIVHKNSSGLQAVCEHENGIVTCFLRNLTEK